MAKRPKLVAKRCNTLERTNDVMAFVSCIEVDLMTTSDNKLVVGHPTSFQARNYTLEQARNRECAMTFDELAQLISERNLFVFLDLKYEGMGKLVAEEVLRLKLQKRVVIISWSQQNLKSAYIASKDAVVSTGWIVNGALADPGGDCIRLGNNYFVTCLYYLSDDFLRMIDFCNNSEIWERMGRSKIHLCVREVRFGYDIERAVRLNVDYIFASPSINLDGMKFRLEELVP